jgi:NTP pyrophosphatase (non-canonical NTP hydrolase)|tara:strand:- start:385 stop:732 length:348 start_codon:yes stop_codon:yes gene_type:complete
MDSITEITSKIREFRDERDWMQFHNPKELAAAIAIESAELQEIFLWKDYPASESTVRDKHGKIADEIADIAVYLFELADNLGLQLGDVMLAKMQKNAEKYPVEKARGSNRKYTEL